MDASDIRRLFPGLKDTVYLNTSMARLRNANVIASVRAVRIRLASHFYNLEEELVRVAGLIAGR